MSCGLSDVFFVYLSVVLKLSHIELNEGVLLQKVELLVMFGLFVV